MTTATLRTARLGTPTSRSPGSASAPGRSGAAATTGGWGSQDDEESIAAIHHALELGVNWIDTAPQYGFGHSDQV